MISDGQVDQGGQTGTACNYVDQFGSPDVSLCEAESQCQADPSLVSFESVDCAEGFTCCAPSVF